MLSVSYARELKASDGIKRGRWYIEPGVGPAGFDSEGRRIREAGLKLGVRLETETFGLVDLYIIGSGEFILGGGG